MSQIISGRVRKISKPRNVQVGLMPGFKTCVLNVIHKDGSCVQLKVSSKVAEVLIANGMGYEG